MISKMKKLVLAIPERDVKKTIRKLMWLECVEIEKTDMPCERKEFYISECVTLEQDIKEICEAKRILERFGVEKQSFLKPLPRISRKDFDRENTGKVGFTEIKELACKINLIKASVDRLSKEKEELEKRAERIVPWLECDIAFSESETEYTETLFGTVPVRLWNDLNKCSEKIIFQKISSDKYFCYVTATFLKKDKSEVLSTLLYNGFKISDIEDMSKTSVDEWSLNSERIKKAKKSILEYYKEIESYFERYKDLLIALDIAKTNLSLARENEKFFYTERTAVISAWIPGSDINILENSLSGEAVYMHTEEPDENENIPVKLCNGRTAGFFESIVKMYSLPKYGSFDPTVVTAIFFVFIFGMMLADIAYGVMLIALGLIVCKMTSLPRGVKDISAVFGVCGVSCVIWGAVFGSILGDMPLRVSEMLGLDYKSFALLDITENSVAFLILSLVVGAIHILFGMGIRIYTLCKKGKVFSAVFDEGSYFVIFAGMGVLFLNIKIGGVLVTLGAFMLILTQGRAEKNLPKKILKGFGSLYGLVGRLSDLLSYSRIMALGLSSAVVASVFNILAEMAGFSFPGVLFFVLITVAGHILNLAINLLGAFVHTSRLQYIEFFGRFYEDSGRPFKPIAPITSHSLPYSDKH